MILLFTDLAIWALLYFPILTGGLWINRTGLKIELSELSVPVLICSALLALSYKRKGSTAVFRLSSVRVALRAWSFWEKKIEERPQWALSSLVILIGSIFAYASLRRHWAYESSAYDLGIYTGALWNLTHGFGYISSLKDGTNLFQDHQNPTFWLFAPFFKAFPYTETLLILQGLIIASGAIPLYWLSRQYSPEKRWFHAALPLLYLAYLPLRNANAFDFHPEVAMLPLFLSAIVGIQSKNRLSQALGAGAFLLALGCKESAGPVAAGIGLAWIFGAAPFDMRERCRWLGSAAFLLGCFVFYVDTKWIPSHSGWNYTYQNNYASFGGSTLDILLSPILKPKVFWSHLLGPTRLAFLFWLLAPVAFLPLFKRRSFWTLLFAASPGFLLIALSNGDYRVRIIYHYAIEPAVGIFFALAIAFSEIKNWNSPRLKLAVLFFALVVFGRSEIHRIRFHTESPHEKWLSETVLPAIPPHFSVATNGSIAPHLVNRFWIHQIPFIDLPGGKTVDCILFDRAEKMYPLETHQIEGFLRRVSDLLRYREVYRCGTLSIFQKEFTTDSQECLSKNVTCIE
jgi:uncharacterized membrane protein